MIPPFPSPPIMALVFFMSLTTFTSPTALAWYIPPCFSVISLKALETAKKKLVEMYHFIKDNYDKGRDEKTFIDEWFESKINEAIRNTTQAMENMLFKSAVQASFLDMNRNLKWYFKRTDSKPNKKLINLFIEYQLKLLTPIIPHFCEECWEIIGGKSFISDEKWPEYDESLIKPKLDNVEDLIISMLSDIREVIKLAKIESPKTIKLIVSPEWKYDLFLQDQHLPRMA